jgi:choline dehydrogenase
MSTASAYLVPARGRPNLTIWTDTAAQRLCWAEPGPGGGAPRVSGVELRRGGALLQVSARREVIVAAGALHSPQLLQCSGIGDAAQLQSIGVAPRVHSPDVGRHLQDHLQVRLRYGLTRPLSLNDLYHRKTQAAGEVLKYLLGRRGRLAQPPIRAGAFCRSSPAEPRPDLQVHFIEFTSDGMGQPPHRHSGIQFSVCVLRPRSRGLVQATGPSMDQPPHICGHFFSDDDDVQRSLRGVHMARRWAAQPALAQLLKAEDDPGPQVQDAAALVDWMRGNAVTVYHPVGTCRMGADAAAVLDPQLRVRGVEGLRVADASVMPALVSGNTNAPTIMIGEKAADLIAAAHSA